MSSRSKNENDQNDTESQMKSEKTSPDGDDALGDEVTQRESTSGGGDQYGCAQMGGRPSLKKFIGIQDACGNKRIWRMMIAEFIGTMLLVFIGCGSCLTITGGEFKSPGAMHVLIALTFGLAVATIAQALGHVSGAHLNPAVSLGLVAAGQCSILKALVYIIMQCLGAIVGAGVLKVIVPGELHGGEDGLGMTVIQTLKKPIIFENKTGKYDTGNFTEIQMPEFAGCCLESIITFVLVLTVCGVCDSLRKDVKGSAPLAIGLSITVCHLMAIRFTGSSMNPARSLGPAVVQGNFKNHWIYWVGPIFGGITAGFLYQITFQEKPVQDESLINPERRRIAPYK